MHATMILMEVHENQGVRFLWENQKEIEYFKHCHSNSQLLHNSVVCRFLLRTISYKHIGDYNDDQITPSIRSLTAVVNYIHFKY